MKNLSITILMTIVCSGVAMAQDAYRPFVEEGKTWHMLLHTEAPIDEPEWNFDYVIQGDTVIAGLEAKKVYSINEVNTGAVVYKMALREEDRKVFFIAPGSEQQHVLYDFNGTTGDVVSVAGVINNNPGYVNMRILANNKVTIHGIDRQVYRVKLSDANYDEDIYSGWWIEGIGSELGPFKTCGFGAVGNVRFLLSCEVNGETIYDGSDQLPDEYIPLLREGVKWVYSEELTNSSPEDEIVIVRLYSMEVKGDTTINDIVYKKIYRTSNTTDYYGAALCSNTQPVACLREEGTKVYAKVLNDDYYDVPFLDDLLSNVTTNGEVILYEFDEDEGSHSTLIGTTIVDTHLCNVYSCEWLYGEVIEGVGLDTDSFGDLLLFSRSATTGYPYSYIGLHHMEDAKGNIIYYGRAYNNGDLNGDGITDVEDLNILINSILSNRYRIIYDQNYDQIIDIEDVNILINKILKLE